ncbi:3-dehydroshikimate dehydratase [Aspergillus steynii IBT 23096]|uniref:3-dehydroshikimate dehydratase n=1 Tax=Aspergillus steynii IBT 23096 TaxID=1392250 RepID=A0A2I2G3K5_9EURO|nr:3-dehydroshikimate dehydratase [Aspergillus steynii IBT 23096]PLB47437.1 3-dehydroshikimate dehydratase [Aspergillus steynii IBT 23096]
MTTTDQRAFAYLVGIGVTHSIAPPMHEFIAQSLGHNWRFIAKECATIEDAMKLFRQPTFAGGVVTMPYKTSIMNHLDGVDEQCLKIGACNNVYRAMDGSLRGANTDWRGIEACLTLSSEEGTGKPAMIIGAGGASRAAVYALYDQLGCNPIYVVNREEEEVATLLRDTELYGADLHIIHLQSVQQTKALGAKPFYIVGTVPDFEPQSSTEIEARNILTEILSAATERGVLLDMCFKPRRTRTLKLGEKYGWKTIFYEDLEYAAKSHGEVNSTTLLAAAKEARELCDAHGLVIIGLQPFLFYEGLKSRQDHAGKIEKLKLWFQIVKVLQTNLIQIPTNFLPPSEISDDVNVIVQDMIEVADLGLKENPPVRFAYENLAWGTYIDSWDAMWEVVRRVDRPNFGCCLDTFNIAGRVWADPASSTGKTPNADGDLEASMKRLVDTVDVKKVFYVQVVDAERMQSPLVEGHPFYAEEQPARMSWSRNARLFLYEQDRGGYLPAVQVARAILKDLGFEGWVSMELFSRSMSDPDPSVPESHAQRGIAAWRKLREELHL